MSYSFLFEVMGVLSSQMEVLVYFSTTRNIVEASHLMVVGEEWVEIPPCYFSPSTLKKASWLHMRSYFEVRF